MGKLIALLTDFGTDDIYVGVMKGVMKRICSEVEFIDISHEVTRQSVQDGALMLRNSYQYFPKGTVFLVVIDPTVGSQRRPILVETDDYRFVAPDNGILTPILDEIGTWKAVELANPKYQLSDSSFTFHGRDIFAPGAAFAARADTELSEFGGFITDLVRLPQPKLQIQENTIIGEITHIDHFGNVITSIGRLKWIEENQIQLEIDAQAVKINAINASVTIEDLTLNTIKKAYYEVGVGDLLLQVDSNGFLEIAINQGNAAHRLDLSLHDTIKLVWD